MAQIESGSTVTFTMAQIGAFLGTFLVGSAGLAWLVFSATTSGLRDDVGVIRQSIVALQTSDKDGAVRIREVDLKLVEQLSGLRVVIAGLDGRIANFDTKIDGLNKNMDALAARLGEIQKSAELQRASLTDPARLKNLAETIKKLGAPNDNIFIIPIEALSVQPK